VTTAIRQAVGCRPLPIAIPQEIIRLTIIQYLVVTTATPATTSRFPGHPQLINRIVQAATPMIMMRVKTITMGSVMIEIAVVATVRVEVTGIDEGDEARLFAGEIGTANSLSAKVVFIDGLY